MFLDSCRARGVFSDWPLLHLTSMSLLSTRNADVCGQPLLWVTAMNVKLPVPSLTSDWVLSKLLLVGTQRYRTSISHSALSLGKCMSWQKTLQIRGSGVCSDVWWTARMKKKKNVRWDWHDWHGVGQERAWTGETREAHNTPADGHALAAETDRTMEARFSTQPWSSASRAMSGKEESLAKHF